jgi:hypothetical protein
MSSPSAPVPATFSFGRMLLGFLLPVLGHGLAFGSTFVVARIVEPSAGGGFEDVVAAIATFFLIEALLIIGSIIAIVMLLIRKRRDVALGVFLGWLVGPAVFFGARLYG